MLIEQKPIATKSLSVRMDEEAFNGIRSLANSVNKSPSIILRVAIFDLLQKQKKLRANTLIQLMETANEQ